MVDDWQFLSNSAVFCSAKLCSVLLIQEHLPDKLIKSVQPGKEVKVMEEKQLLTAPETKGFGLPVG